MVKLLEFNVDDSLPGNDFYRVVDRTLRSSGKAEPLGRGNVGVVFRAQYKRDDQYAGLDRAIKFLSPLKEGDRQAHLALHELEDTFDREIRLLSTITHTSICKIVDFGHCQIGDHKYPYYVMDLIKGMTFDKFCADETTSAEDFLTVLDQILDALGHLHIRGYFHMDVKEENILIQRPSGSGPRAILLDLGGAKQVRAENDVILRENTIYISSKQATRGYRRDKLGEWLPRSTLETWGADLDFYALGVMIKRAVESKSSLRFRLEKHLSTSGLAALEWIVDHLIGDDRDVPGTARYYKNIAQTRSDFRRLFPNYTWPLGLPELSFVVSPDSIQLPRERVGLTPSLLRIVNHPVFQRLRNIPQLEYVHLVYPGARQSRFEHALSAFQLARLFLVRLLEYPEFRMIASPSHVQATLLAVLLHDIGHYPLSHMFEDFAASGEEGGMGSGASVPSDDDLFRCFLHPTRGDSFADIIKKALAGQGENVKPLDSLIRELYSQEILDLVMKILDQQTTHPDPIPLLHSLIDSAIDVDKTAYITDDSYASGVRFGQGLDTAGLIESLTLPRGEDRRRGALAITENGLAAAESIVLARFWMIARVYWHRTNRAIMAMHKYVITDLVEGGRLNFEKYYEQTLFNYQAQATEILAHQFDTYHNAALVSDEEVRNPLHGLIGAKREIYKRLLTISSGPATRDKILYQRILDRKAADILTLAEDIRKLLAEQYPNIKWKRGDVVVDIPHKQRELLGSKVLVYLDRDPLRGKDLYGGSEPVSPLLTGIPEDFESNYKKFRVFIHPTILDALERDDEVQRVRDITRSYLDHRFKVPVNV